MKKTLAILVLVGALTASAGVNVYHTIGGYTASDDEPARVVGPTKRVCPSLEELGLTAGQRKKLSGCCGMCTNRRNELQKEIRTLIADLERELNAPSVNAERVYQLADELGELRAQELKSRVNTIVQVRETLTPSQLERLVDAVEEPFAVPDGAKEKGE